jgi:hypothetical protein
VRTDLDTFVALGSGELRVDDPDVARRMQVEGDPAAARRCVELLAPAALGVPTG